MKYLLRLFLLLLATGFASQAISGKLVKWYDEDGNLHYGDSIPPEYAQQAREELNDQGVIVKQVERAKTEEEVAAEKRAQAQAEAAALEAADLKRRDQVVLNSYTSSEEVLRARDAKLEGIDRNIELAQVSISTSESSLADLRQRAADLERTGKPVSDALRTSMDSLAEQIKTQEAFIQREEAKKDAIRADYKDQYERFVVAEERAAERKAAAEARRQAQADAVQAAQAEAEGQ